MVHYAYRLPELGEGLHEGEIVKWLVKPGDTIKEDEPLIEVRNDKAVVEVPSPVTGVIQDIQAGEGSRVVVGDVLAVIAMEGEIAKSPSPEPAKSIPPPVKEEGWVLATPSVRKFAQERGVNLLEVQGSGSHGRITREDIANVQAEGTKQAEGTPPIEQDRIAVSAPDDAPVPHEERMPFQSIRKLIAEAMVKSVYTAPHVTVMDEVDVTTLVALRERMKPHAQQREIKLTYLPFLMKALVAAIRAYPILNAMLDDDRNEIIIKKVYHVGIATDTDSGLIVPVLKDAERKSMFQLAQEIHDLAQRGRSGKLLPHEMRGSTITITNIGSAGGMFFTPVINFPEAAILGTGRIAAKPIVRDGAVVVGQVMSLSLSFDHRLIDGATAQHAMNTIKKLLHDPELLMMEV
jgi:pyruvate dehydrogenase E2 component (dihydrolipoamide acetyltransferase)